MGVVGVWTEYVGVMGVWIEYVGVVGVWIEVVGVWIEYVGVVGVWIGYVGVVDVYTRLCGEWGVMGVWRVGVVGVRIAWVLWAGTRGCGESGCCEWVDRVGVMGVYARRGELVFLVCG